MEYKRYRLIDADSELYFIIAYPASRICVKLTNQQFYDFKNTKTDPDVFTGLKARIIEALCKKNDETPLGKKDTEYYVTYEELVFVKNPKKNDNFSDRKKQLQRDISDIRSKLGASKITFTVNGTQNKEDLIITRDNYGYRINARIEDDYGVLNKMSIHKTVFVPSGKLDDFDEYGEGVLHFDRKEEIQDETDLICSNTIETGSTLGEELTMQDSANEVLDNNKPEMERGNEGDNSGLQEERSTLGKGDSSNKANGSDGDNTNLWDRIRRCLFGSTLRTVVTSSVVGLLLIASVLGLIKMIKSIRLAQDYSKWAKKYSMWSTEYPEEVPESLIETRIEYRHRDYVTKTSYNTSMDGWEQIYEEWFYSDSGTIDYVSSWPSGFDQNNEYYVTYNSIPKAVFETATEKTISTIETNEYIYWHWCSNQFTDGPANRLIEEYQTEVFCCFHAFTSSTDPSSLEDSYGEVFKISNPVCCHDSYWYFAIPVQSQTWRSYKKLFTYGHWAEWSEWSSTPVESSENCEVQTRFVYRVIQPKSSISANEDKTMNPYSSDIYNAHTESSDVTSNQPYSYVVKSEKN